ncbi:nucleoid-associated protein [Elizabethkingia anophelis]|uniref:nucleoid-associated protein n=1 Tax=Elizabethkingia anophelis TaxID=1117645 RepID=UPI0038927058
MADIEIKQKGHDLTIRNIIIHQINKDQGKDIVALKLADRLLSISKKEIFFIADVKKSFSGPGKTYGIFEEQNESTVFENLIEKYVNGGLDFLKMTQELMKYYEKILKGTITATGGYLVFSDYFNKNNGKEYLLVLAINNKQSYLFNEDLTLSEIQSIDLNKIDIASLINISQWQEFKKGNHDIDTYLSFRSGLKGISQYFQAFVGCANKTTKTVGSKKLVVALKDFLDTKNINKEVKDEILDRIRGYCIDCDKENKGAKLSDISRIVDEDNPDDFAYFATEEKYSVNPIISIDRNVIKLLTRTKYKSKNEDFLIEFDNTLIGNKIRYIEKTNSILIEDIPEELAAQIKKHI